METYTLLRALNAFISLQRFIPNEHPIMSYDP